MRIHLSNGARYEIRHFELMIATRKSVFIAIPPGPEGVPERFVRCAPVHITRVNPMDGA